MTAVHSYLLADIKLYCLVTDTTHVCDWLVKGHTQQLTCNLSYH